MNFVLFYITRVLLGSQNWVVSVCAINLGRFACPFSCNSCNPSKSEFYSFFASIALNSCLPAHSSLHLLLNLFTFVVRCQHAPFSLYLLSCLSCLNFRPLMQYLYTGKSFLPLSFSLSLSFRHSLDSDDKHNAENCINYRGVKNNWSENSMRSFSFDLIICSICSFCSLGVNKLWYNWSLIYCRQKPVLQSRQAKIIVYLFTHWICCHTTIVFQLFRVKRSPT